MEKFFREHWKIILIATVSLIVTLALNYIFNCDSNEKLFDKIKAETDSLKEQIKNKT